MPTLDWLNRATAFTTAAQVPYRLLDTVSRHGAEAQAGDNLEHKRLASGNVLKHMPYGVKAR